MATRNRSRAFLTLVWMAAALLAGCGGGGDGSAVAVPTSGSGGPTTLPTVTTTIPAETTSTLPAVTSSVPSATTSTATTPGAPSVVTASGSVILGSSITFVPQADGFRVTVKFDRTEYLFFKNTVITSGSSVTTLPEQLQVTRYLTGESRVAYSKSTSSAGSIVYLCAGDCGVTYSPAAVGSHPISITFGSTRMVTTSEVNIPSAIGLPLTGTLTGDATPALWSPLELPRSTTGTLDLDARALMVVSSRDDSRAALGTSIFILLEDGSDILVSKPASTGIISVSRVFAESTAPARGLVQQCRSGCGVAVTPNTGGGYTVVFSGTKLATLLNSTTSLGSATSTLNGSFTMAGRVTGTLTSDNASIAPFTPTTADITATNDVRQYTFNDYVPGNTLLSVTTRAGVVVSASLARDFGGTLFTCLEGGLAIRSIPACTGITVGADGLTLNFVNAPLGGAVNANFSGILKGR